MFWSVTCCHLTWGSSQDFYPGVGWIISLCACSVCLFCDLCIQIYFKSKDLGCFLQVDKTTGVDEKDT